MAPLLIYKCDDANDIVLRILLLAVYFGIVCVHLI